VKGTLPAKSTPRKLVLAIEEPAQHAAATLKRLFEERGIKVGGAARARTSRRKFRGSDRSGGTVSVPLGDSVKLVNKISQNLHTEMLLRTVARQSGVWTTPDDLMRDPRGFLRGVGHCAGGRDSDGRFRMSRHDLVTPRAIRGAAGLRAKADLVRAVLRVAAGGGGGRHAGRSHEEHAGGGRVHAKTGSVEHVRTLSGFAETLGGRRLIFPSWSNNQAKNHEAATR